MTDRTPYAITAVTNAALSVTPPLTDEEHQAAVSRTLDLAPDDESVDHAWATYADAAVQQVTAERTP